jgi:hypothetical protein
VTARLTFTGWLGLREREIQVLASTPADLAAVSPAVLAELWQAALERVGEDRLREIGRTAPEVSSADILVGPLVISLFLDSERLSSIPRPKRTRK